ncbi:hypothetical protein ABNQ39_36845 (plasmid) [Azospirillum sp. A26]|uniref:hypothetical protein n=1 Tax=Azospirillum sp. A26 TaxID=3160607 RepID=UPI0036701BC8
MDPRFSRMVTDPWNQVFQVVFFPDRIYHAQYLNATRSPRYRYNVREVRGKADINVLKGDVHIDGSKMSNFVRVEYRASRLTEAARERGRFVRDGALAYVQLVTLDGESVGATCHMQYCPWIDAFQVEIWQSLEPPPGHRHDFQVTDMMGHRGSITCVPAFAGALADVSAIGRVNLAFRESDVQGPGGRHLSEQEARWDNFFERNIQVPNTDHPSDDRNTVKTPNYGVDFQRGWFIDDVRSDVKPVRYQNAMMEREDPNWRQTPNIVEMRWILQQEFGGSLVFFHEVKVPPKTVEGTHRHIGSEELYYITEGAGVAYLGELDDPKLANHPTVDRHVYGFGMKRCKMVEVGPGSVIFTKSGGIHGIENRSEDKDLRFVAFLYHSA